MLLRISIVVIGVVTSFYLLLERLRVVVVVSTKGVVVLLFVLVVTGLLKLGSDGLWVCLRRRVLELL